MPLREFIKLLAKEEPADHSMGVGGKSFHWSPEPGGKRGGIQEGG